MTQSHTIEVSTEVYHLLKQRRSPFIGWEDAKPGLIQKIMLDDAAYATFIDRAIAQRQTLDQVIREACTKTKSPPPTSWDTGGNPKPVSGTN